MLNRAPFTSGWWKAPFTALLLLTPTASFSRPALCLPPSTARWGSADLCALTLPHLKDILIFEGRRDLCSGLLVRLKLV